MKPTINGREVTQEEFRDFWNGKNPEWMNKQMEHLKPEPEPNWRQIVTEQGLRIKELTDLLNGLQKAYDDLNDMYVELQERDG